MFLVLAQEAEFYGQTTVHPLGLAAVAVLGIATLVLPRPWAIAPMIIMACFVSLAQRVVVASLDFNFLRLMVMFGWVRVLMYKEYAGFVWRPLDMVLVLWSLSGTVAYTALHGEFSDLIYKLGVSYDAVGMYFFARCVIRGERDVRGLAFLFAILAIPVMAAFGYEQVTGKNLFAGFGGVPSETLVRDGRRRAQGAFPHAIIAGCFWAGVLPWIAALWWDKATNRAWVVIGALSSLLIVIFCASSTPVVAVAAAMFAAGLFVFRHALRTIRWGVVVLLVILHFVMNAPVWHLVSRINIVGGSTGWHRYHLIDEAIRRAEEWVFFGTESTGHWGYGLQDVTNQYVLEGVRGGLLTLILFVLSIGLAFRDCGILWRRAPRGFPLAAAWACGVALFVHAVSFIAVSYFGQITMLWYLSLAIPASLVAWGGAGRGVHALPAGYPAARPAPQGHPGYLRA